MKLKKINLILLMIITSFMLINTCYADTIKNQCKKHYNYYFLFNVRNSETFLERLNTTPSWEIINETTFSQIHTSDLTNKQTIKNIKKSNICIVKNETDTCNTDYFEEEKITYNEFWTKYIYTLNNYSFKEEYSLEDYENTASYILKEDNKKYIVHKNYKKLSDDNEDTSTQVPEDPTKANFKEADIPNLVNASASISKLITESTITDTNEPFYLKIIRTLEKEPHNTNLQPFNPLIQETQTTMSSIFIPAMYKITYDVCNEPYNANITYINKETGEEVAEPYNEKKYPGEGDNVKSPEIKNCTPNETTVSYKIDETNPSDFKKIVTYSCINENPKTGNTFIGGIIIIAIISLVSIIYFTKRNKTKNQ